MNLAMGTLEMLTTSLTWYFFLPLAFNSLGLMYPGTNLGTSLTRNLMNFLNMQISVFIQFGKFSIIISPDILSVPFSSFLLEHPLHVSAHLTLSHGLHRSPLGSVLLLFFTVWSSD